MRMATQAVIAGIVALAGSAFAQSSVPAATAAPAAAAPSTGVPQRDTLIRMMRPVAIEFKETRLEDVMRFIADVTQADIEVMWQDDKNPTGLDKDAPISANFQKGTALDLVEKVMEKAGDAAQTNGGNTWQMTESGTFQVGPKERLNRWRRLEIYSIADLLLEVPDFNQAPEFDLQAVLQNTGQGGGGGGQSPFRDNQSGGQAFTKNIEAKTNDLITLITTLVEQEQWVDNGGSAATIRAFQGNLLINAPDYIHRQVNGYPWWPAAATHATSQKGRRYVTLGVDSSIAKLVGFRQVPVTAVTGGGDLVRSNPGPGGSATPAQQPPK